jgi:excisionase family DNA binding protein
MSTVDLVQLAALPDIVQQLQARVEGLEQRLTVAERRPYSVADAARALGVSEKTIRRRIAMGKIQHQRTGARVVVYLPC